jgi:hypothetical protein
MFKDGLDFIFVTFFICMGVIVESVVFELYFCGFFQSFCIVAN